jgi:hypothetical protein
MSIKFLNLNQTINSARPAGFKFPTGLTVAPLTGEIVVYFGATDTFTVPTGITSVDYL